jgi:hypothetical protein
MIAYRKPIIALLAAASIAIEGLGKLEPVIPEGLTRTSGLAYDLDE